MSEIPQVKGNKQNIDFFARSFQKGMLSHAYIIDGAEGSGKEALADFLAAALLCDEVNGKDTDPNQQSWGSMMGISQGPKEFVPCGKCPSCIKALSGNHPDIIHVRHEKSTVLSVAEVRQQVVEDISIKPYYGPYKIYIVDDAHLLNENGQNALLKTIEEPQSYGIIFLMTDNSDGFLQTIRSRCIRINMDPPTNEETADSLLDEKGMELADLLGRAENMNALQISKAAKSLEETDRNQTINMLRIWFRDVLVYKCTSDKNRIILAKQMESIIKMAGKTSYEGINTIILGIDEADTRIKTSVKAEAAYESLLLLIRRTLKK